jgi:hypothetical protein
MELESPTEALAGRILAEVGFEDRITGYRLRERTGIMTIRLYSFGEVVGLLNDPYPRLDFAGLQRWISETMGDPELAGKIGDAIQEDTSEQVRSIRIRDLMAQRLSQCLEHEGIRT